MGDKAKFKPTERFTGLAEIYAQARPTYPQSAIDFIMERCGLDHSSILADIGCGTGISSRLFSLRGLQVIGIEPNDEMREFAAHEEATHASPPVRYQKGTAEQTSLPDSCLDALLAAQAFHWFEAEPTLHEFHRILKPTGWAVLMWNERDESDRFTTAYGDVIRAQKETNAVEKQRGRIAGEPLLQSSLFKDARMDKFFNEQIVDEEGLIARACSASYVPKDGPELDQMKDDLRAVFQRFQRNGKVAIKYETLVFTAQKP
jgi:ubiquinone/menaquinone biosynthesis C-methylase UbiE